MSTERNILDTIRAFGERTQMREFVLSSGITFISAFIMSISVLLPLSPENIDRAMLVSIFFTGVRAGLKALLQYLATKIK